MIVVAIEILCDRTYLLSNQPFVEIQKTNIFGIVGDFGQDLQNRIKTDMFSS